MKLILIIDPDVFFQFYEGEIHLHPILTSWIYEIRSNNRLTEFYLYFLERVPGQKELNITIGQKSFSLPFGLHFCSLLSKDAHRLLTDLCGKSLFFVHTSPQSATGINGFSEGGITSPKELIVVTADKKIALFFSGKNIPVAKLKNFHYPVIYNESNLIKSKAFSKKIYQERVLVYCDFDGTIFDCHHYLMFEKLNQEIRVKFELSQAEQAKKLFIENTVQGLLSKKSQMHLVYPKTIELLGLLRQHPTFLITQRSFTTDSTQPYYNCAAKIVERINKEQNLRIIVRPDHFLDHYSQMVKGEKTYLKKVEFIYHKMLTLTNHRPKYIVFIDDNLDEHIYAELTKGKFEELGITLIPILIIHNMYFTLNYFRDIEQYIPGLYDQLNEIISIEEEKLNAAFDYSNRVQGLHQKTIANNPYTLYGTSKTKAEEKDRGCRCTLF